MKKKIISAIGTIIGIVALSNSAQAAYPGFGVGLQLGEGLTHFSAGDVAGVNTASVKKSGLSGRVFANAQFTQYWGAELGYTKYYNTRYSAINGTTQTGHIKEHAVDLVAKATGPFYYDSNIYGKLGAAYVRATTHGALTGDHSKVMPTFGVGLTHEITPNVPVELSWTRIQKINGSIPSSDLIAIGIGWKFS